MIADLRGIEYHLPDVVLTNQQLATEFPDWSIDKIEQKTGIVERRIAAPDECASDLAIAAARRLFDSGVCSPAEIDYILLCTQSPDYFLPTTACLVQDRLGIPTDAGAVDFNQGCSGFIYGLGLAKGLIETGQVKKALLLTAETYSKFIHPQDKSVRTLFGDAAAATFIQGSPEDGNGATRILSTVFGTDGRGARNLIVQNGAFRNPMPGSREAAMDEFGNVRSEDNLYMNGPEIFNFTLKVVPACVQRLLANTDLKIEDIDLFVFHQANQYMLEHLRRKMRIPEQKFYIHLKDCGNTVSSTIPIALKHACAEGFLRPGTIVMLVGFGVGYSWGAALLRWGSSLSTS